jgi:D-amino peptidase
VAARAAIAAAAEVAVRESAQARCFKIATPVHCQLETRTPAYADLFCQWPELERVDGVTVTFSAPSVQAVVRMLNCLSAMSFMLK